MLVSAKKMNQFYVKVILVTLIVLEVAVIAMSYSFKFDDYVLVNVIVLSILVSYFGYQYLRNRYRSVKTYESIKNATKIEEVSMETKREINKLIESSSFKRYKQSCEKAREADYAISELDAEKIEDIKGVMEELTDMEETIFDL